MAMSVEEKRERRRQWKLHNPEKVKEQKKRWKLRNPEKVKERDRKRLRNSDKDKERRTLWKSNNPDKVKEHKQLGRLKKRYPPELVEVKLLQLKILAALRA